MTYKVTTAGTNGAGVTNSPRVVTGDEVNSVVRKYYPSAQPLPADQKFDLKTAAGRSAFIDFAMGFMGKYSASTLEQGWSAVKVGSKNALGVGEAATYGDFLKALGTAAGDRTVLWNLLPASEKAGYESGREPVIKE